MCGRIRTDGFRDLPKQCQHRWTSVRAETGPHQPHQARALLLGAWLWSDRYSYAALEDVGEWLAVGCALAVCSLHTGICTYGGRLHLQLGSVSLAFLEQWPCSSNDILWSNTSWSIR